MGFESLPYNALCDRCDCRMPRGTQVARCACCQYDVCFGCQEGACVVVRNTFLEIDEPKVNQIRQRRRSEPCAFGCMLGSEDSVDDESECSTDVGGPDGDDGESNEVQLVVRNTF